MQDAKCQESVQNWDGRLPVRKLRLWFFMFRQLGLVVFFFEEIREHVWWVLVYWNVAHLIHVCICAELWRAEAAVMLEELAGNVARCGQSEDVCSLDIGLNDVGWWCVVTHLAMSRTASWVQRMMRLRMPAMLWVMRATSSSEWCWISG